MTRYTGWCVALMLTLLALPALGDDALLGTWTLATIGDTEPADGQSVTYVFGAETVEVTFAVAGRSQTWQLAYTVLAEGELTLEPGDGPGEPTPSVITYSIEDGKLVLELEGLGAAMTFNRQDAGE